MELSAAVFGIEPNEVVLHEAVKNYLANQRQGTQSTLTRSEVRGGGIKPWRQKGTGRARQGSMGACSSPSRVFKGKMMPGQMGNEQVTVQTLDVVKVDPELNMIAVRGAVPGPKGGIVFLKNTVKNA